MSRTVVFVAVNEKYMNVPYYASATIDVKTGKYITGQENLTPEELKEQPFIIDVDETYPITHNYKMVVNEGKPKTKDDVLFNLFMLDPKIAKSVRRVDKSNHLFVINDVEKEAEEDVTKAEKIFEAQDKVRQNLSHEQLKDLAIFLDEPVKGRTIAQMQARIYATILNDPDKVLKFFNNTSKDEIFIKKLIHYGILDKKGGRILSAGNNNFILGDNITEAISWLKKPGHEEYNDSWGRKLNDLEEKYTPEEPVKKGRGAGNKTS